MTPPCPMTQWRVVAGPFGQLHTCTPCSPACLHPPTLFPCILGWSTHCPFGSHTPWHRGFAMSSPPPTPTSRLSCCVSTCLLHGGSTWSVSAAPLVPSCPTFQAKEGSIGPTWRWNSQTHQPHWMIPTFVTLVWYAHVRVPLFT